MQDPLMGKYPSLSPYCYAANNPLNFIDNDGRAIKRAGYGYISGDEAAQITMQVMDVVLKGNAARIDFVGESNAWEDLKDAWNSKSFFGSHSYSPFNPLRLRFGESIETLQGSGSIEQMFVDTRFAFINITKIGVEKTTMTTKTGDDLFTLVFQVMVRNNYENIIQYKDTFSALQKLLKKYNKVIKKHVTKYRHTDTKTGKTWYTESVKYFIEDNGESEKNGNNSRWHGYDPAYQ